MLRSVIVFLVHIFSVIVFRVKLVGKENVPKEGAYIMCANHQSNWDAPILVSSTKRRMHVMAKEELFKNKFIYWLGEKCLVFPLKRGKMDLDSMKHSLKAQVLFSLKINQPDVIKNTRILHISIIKTRKN